MHMKNIQNLTKMQNRLQRLQKSPYQESKMSSQYDGRAPHPSGGMQQTQGQNQFQSQYMRANQLNQMQYELQQNQFQQEELAKATAALVDIKKRKDLHNNTQRNSIFSQEQSIYDNKQNRKPDDFDDREGNRARTNHGARPMKQGDGQQRHRRNISYQDFQGAQIQRMRSLKYMNNNFVEMQNAMPPSENFDQFVQSRGQQIDSQTNNSRLIQSPSLINIGQNIMSSEQNEFGGRRDYTEMQGNEQMNSQNHNSSEYFRQATNGFNRDLQRSNAHSNENMSKFIKERVMMGTLRKSQAQPNQRQNGLRDSYQRLGNQFIPPQTAPQAAHGFTPRNIGRLLQQRATITRGSQSQGRDRPPQQATPSTGTRPNILTSTGSLLQQQQQQMNRNSIGSFASATRSGQRQATGGDPLINPIDRASIEDQYSALQRGYDDYFRQKTQNQQRNSNIMFNSTNNIQSNEANFNLIEQQRKNELNGGQQQQKDFQVKSQQGQPPDGWRIFTEVGINQIHMGIELEQKVDNHGSIGLKYSLQQRKSSIGGPNNWIPLDLNAQCNFEPQTVNQQPSESIRRESDETRRSQRKKNIKKNTPAKKRGNLDRSNRGITNDPEKNIVFIQQTKRSSGVPSYIDSKNTSRGISTTQPQAFRHMHDIGSNSNDNRLMRTSSLKAPQPTVPSNISSRLHKSPSCQASQDLDFIQRNKKVKNQIPNQTMNPESLKNSMGEKSELTGEYVSPDKVNKDSQNLDYAPSFAEYLKNKVIERESKMSGVSQEGSNSSRSRLNEVAEMLKSTTRDISKGSQEPYTKKISFSDKSQQDQLLNSQKQKDFGQTASRNTRGSSQVRSHQLNYSTELQKKTRIYMGGENAHKGQRNQNRNNPVQGQAVAVRSDQDNQIQESKALQKLAKKSSTKQSQYLSNERIGQQAQNSKRSQSQSTQRAIADMRPQPSEKSKKQSESQVKHNDMDQTTRDIKDLLHQNESFKDVDQEQISKLLQMLQQDKGKQEIQKVKLLSPKSKENSKSSKSGQTVQSPRGQTVQSPKSQDKKQPIKKDKLGPILSHRSKNDKIVPDPILSPRSKNGKAGPVLSHRAKIEKTSPIISPRSKNDKSTPIVSPQITIKSPRSTIISPRSTKSPKSQKTQQSQDQKATKDKKKQKQQNKDSNQQNQINIAPLGQSVTTPPKINNQQLESLSKENQSLRSSKSKSSNKIINLNIPGKIEGNEQTESALVETANKKGNQKNNGKRKMMKTISKEYKANDILPIEGGQSSEQKKKTSDESSKNHNLFGQSAGDHSDTQTQKTAMFMNNRISNSKNSQEKQSQKNPNNMRPSHGTQEDDQNVISNQSFVKGSNSADMEIFNQELQNQINDDSIDNSRQPLHFNQQPSINQISPDENNQLTPENDDIPIKSSLAEEIDQQKEMYLPMQSEDNDAEKQQSSNNIEDAKRDATMFDSVQTEQMEQWIKENQIGNNQDSTEQQFGSNITDPPIDQSVVNEDPPIDDKQHQTNNLQIEQQDEIKSKTSMNKIKTESTQQTQLSIENFFLQTLNDFENADKTILQSNDLLEQLDDQQYDADLNDYEQLLNDAKFEIKQQEEEFVVKDYNVMQQKYLDDKVDYSQNDQEIAKIQQQAMPQMKIQKKIQSVEFQNKSFSQQKKIESTSFVDDIRNSIFSKLNKSLDDTHIKTYNVDQIMKIPFFVKKNKDREKQLSSMITSTLQKNIKLDVNLWKTMFNSLIQDQQQSTITPSKNDGGSPSKEVVNSSQADNSSINQMDQEFNSASKVLKNSPTTLRRGSKILNRASLIKLEDKGQDKKKSKRNLSQVIQPQQVLTNSKSPRKQSIIPGKLGKFNKFADLVDKLNKKSNDDSSIVLKKIEDIKAVEEVPEFLEGQSSCGYESSKNSPTSESSSSFISNLSMMIGVSDQSSSSSHVNSNKSRIWKPIKFKIVDVKRFVTAERETLLNLKLKQQLANKIREQFTKKFQLMTQKKSADGGINLGGLFQNGKINAQVKKFEKYPEFQRDKQNFDGILNKNQMNLQDYENERKKQENIRIQEMHKMFQEDDNDDKSMIYSDITEFSQFEENYMKDLSNNEVQSLQEIFLGELVQETKLKRSNSLDHDIRSHLQQARNNQTIVPNNSAGYPEFQSKTVEHARFRRKSIYLPPFIKEIEKFDQKQFLKSQSLQLSQFFSTNNTKIEKYEKMDIKNLSNLLEWLELNCIEQTLKNFMKHNNKNHPFGKRHSEIHSKYNQYLECQKKYGQKVQVKKQRHKYMRIKKLYKQLERLQDLVDPNENLSEQIKRDQKLKIMLIRQQLNNIRHIVETQFWQKDNPQMQLNYYDFLHKEDCYHDSGSDCSISDECDGPIYNNQISIQSIHYPANFNQLLGTVLQGKNSHFEIFKVLVQTKYDKIKNQVIKDCKDERKNGSTKSGNAKKRKRSPVIDRNEFIDKRLKQIKQIIIKDEDSREKFSKYLSDNSEVSSLFESDDSIEDTSKYIYVEDLESQRLIRQTEEQSREENKIIVKVGDTFKRQLSVSDPKQDHKIKNQRGYIKKILTDGKLYHNFSKEGDYRRNCAIWECGFRYGKKSPLLKKCFQEDEKQDSMGIGRPSIKIIKLRNGLPLDISKKLNVDFDAVNNEKNVHVTIRDKAIRDLQEIQGYYKFIKDHMQRKPQSSSVFYLKYKRQLLLKENQINEQHGSKACLLRSFINVQMLLMMKKNNGQAIQMNVSGKQILTCVNPFLNTQGIDSNLKLLQDREKKDTHKSHRKRFFLAMENKKNQQMANQKQKEKLPDNFPQGLKSKNFKFVGKLQSLGLVSHWRNLQKEMREERFHEISQYKSSLDEDQGFPMYVLFEVLHVKRKTPYDHHIEQKQLTDQLKVYLKQYWITQDELNQHSQYEMKRIKQ